MTFISVIIPRIRHSLSAAFNNVHSRPSRMLSTGANHSCPPKIEILSALRCQHSPIKSIRSFSNCELTPLFTCFPRNLHALRRSSNRNQIIRQRSSEVGKDNHDEEWIPPDHSPLAKIRTRSKRYDELAGMSTSLSHHPAPSPTDIKMEVTSISEIEDEIEVIDLEATLNNPSNLEYLSQIATGQKRAPTDEMFGIESSDADWGEILQELKDEGELDTLQKIVKQYGLQSKLDEIESTDKNRRWKKFQDWDEDFEQSLEELSEDELIDELIENSTSLTQLEMELLSEEMDKGLDLDNDEALLKNPAYMEFRRMVLEDYCKKRRARKENFSDDSLQKECPSTYATSQYSSYPHDWKDYDSKAAFRRDFLEENDSWIPPSKGFIPSMSKPVRNDTSGGPAADGSENDANGVDNTIDWLQARRFRLEGKQKTPTHLLTPEQAESFRHENSQIPVIPYTLLTTSEISTSLSAQGGSDIHIIDTSDYDSLYGVGMGCDYLMIVTGRNSSHIRVLAESVVRNLKARKLHERGIVGAMQGAEGGQDIFSNKRSRNRASRNGHTNLSSRIDDDWMVVDCGNIHVHVLEPVTRKCLNIEGLWDLSDPNSEGSKLRRIDYNNEDEVDTYVAENPVPEEYAARMLSGRNTWITAGVGGRVHKIVPESFTRKSYSSKWGGAAKRDNGKARRR
ncbi:hypothetical protein ACHAW6_007354 [Cyclotella cf. meneghiniana]